MTKPALLEPLTMGSHTAHNRLWLPPMCMYCAEPDGIPTEWHVLHYGSRAQGGFGTIIVEATAVTPNGRLSPGDLGLWEDAQIAGHARLVEAIHAGGALAGIQLGHGGRKAGTPPWRPVTADAAASEARSVTLPGWDLVAPSALEYPGHAVPRELSIPEIEDLVEAFAAAARRAVAAGYDVIELHGAHGYLIHEFLSPLSNTRSDEYGGDTAGRRRFALEVTRAVREAIGPDHVLDIRLSATDWAEGGLTSADTVALCRELVEAGMDVLHISTSGNVPADFPIGPGYQVRFAQDVKKGLADMTTVAGVAPVVVAVGLIESGPQAEQVVLSEQADAVAIGRYALRDPYAPLRFAHELGVNDWQEAHFPIQYWRGTWR